MNKLTQRACAAARLAALGRAGARTGAAMPRAQRRTTNGTVTQSRYAERLAVSAHRLVHPPLPRGRFPRQTGKVPGREPKWQKCAPYRIDNYGGKKSYRLADGVGSRSSGVIGSRSRERLDRGGAVGAHGTRHAAPVRRSMRQGLPYPVLTYSYRKNTWNTTATMMAAATAYATRVRVIIFPSCIAHLTASPGLCWLHRPFGRIRELFAAENSIARCHRWHGHGGSLSTLTFRPLWTRTSRLLSCTSVHLR